MYIGRNTSMTEGFVGCVSRVEFDDIYPLKLLFQQDGPPNVSGMNSKLLPFNNLEYNLTYNNLFDSILARRYTINMLF